MEQQWWHKSVVYQIYPRSFHDSNGDGIGDIPGIVEKLDYLKLLGVDIIWLSPVYDSPNDDNGYDIRDYRQIMKEFGTMEDFDQLISEMHQRGMKLMMDVVLNHSSDEHVWFKEAKSSKDSPFRDYYIFRDGKANGASPNNWGSVFGGSAWEYNETTDDYYLHLFSKKQPDLNWENPKLRQELYSILRFWLDKGVDGFRMDVINFISKTEGLPDVPLTPDQEYGDGGIHYINGPRIHEFLQELHTEALAGYDTITVGEMPGATIPEAIRYTSPDNREVNMVFHFEHVDIGNGPYGKWSPQPWKMAGLKTILDRWQTELKEGWNALYWSNHDQPRAVSRWIEAPPEYREKAAKMLAILLHTMKGTPYIYQGEELGMTNVTFPNIDDYRDIETLNAYRDLVEAGSISHDDFMRAVHERSRDNARTPMHWDSSPYAGFTDGTPWIGVNPNCTEINVEAALQDEQSIFYTYKKLIALRKENPVLVYGSYVSIDRNREDVYAFTRSYEGTTWLTVANMTDRAVPFPDVDIQDAALIISNDDSASSMNLRPFEARVYRICSS
ncbi:MAG: alpha-glucosidase [Bacillus sp. (in: firmicutes)]